MSNDVPAWGPWTKAVRQLFMTTYPPMPDDLAAARLRVGGNFPDEVDDWYIRVDKIPGGRSDRLGGDHIIEVEVFAPSYGVAESVANDLEALLLGYPRVVEVDGETFVFDRVTVNSSPAELPWEDDKVSRIGAVYVITARRS